MQGDCISTLWSEPLETLPAPCFGTDLDEYVDTLAFTTSDLWVIFEVYSLARWDPSLPTSERKAHFVSNMAGRGLTIVEARYIWDRMAVIPNNPNVRQRWAI